MICIDKKYVFTPDELYHATGLMGEDAKNAIAYNIMNAIKVELHNMDIEDIIRIYVVPMVAQRIYDTQEYTTE